MLLALEALLVVAVQVVEVGQAVMGLGVEIKFTITLDNTIIRLLGFGVHALLAHVACFVLTASQTKLLLLEESQLNKNVPEPCLCNLGRTILGKSVFCRAFLVADGQTYSHQTSWRLLVGSSGKHGLEALVILNVSFLALHTFAVDSVVHPLR